MSLHGYPSFVTAIIHLPLCSPVRPRFWSFYHLHVPATQLFEPLHIHYTGRFALFESGLLLVGAWRGHVRPQNGSEFPTTNGHGRANDAAKATTATAAAATPAPGSAKRTRPDSEYDFPNPEPAAGTYERLANRDDNTRAHGPDIQLVSSIACASHIADLIHDPFC
jgi:hypothetical protein